MPGSWVNLLGQLELWRGVGRLVVDLALVVAMYLIVMSVSGHPVALRRTQRADGRKGIHTIAEDPSDAKNHEPRERGADARRLAHLDLLASLRHSMELQGATIVLIVFAVVLLAFNRILGSSEVATILAGITGYVLGTRSQPAAVPPVARGGATDDELAEQKEKK
jgi:small-conductance mechanosensitive channel